MNSNEDDTLGSYTVRDWMCRVAKWRLHPYTFNVIDCDYAVSSTIISACETYNYPLVISFLLDSYPYLQVRQQYLWDMWVPNHSITHPCHSTACVVQRVNILRHNWSDVENLPLNQSRCRIHVIWTKGGWDNLKKQNSYGDKVQGLRSKYTKSLENRHFIDWFA